jgi:hypothetical protein
VQVQQINAMVKDYTPKPPHPSQVVMGGRSEVVHGDSTGAELFK